jgi:hypothetical protein
LKQDVSAAAGAQGRILHFEIGSSVVSFIAGAAYEFY